VSSKIALSEPTCCGYLFNEELNLKKKKKKAKNKRSNVALVTKHFSGPGQGLLLEKLDSSPRCQGYAWYFTLNYC
jgi:hypothetical protein